jgi:acyl carrier protein
MPAAVNNIEQVIRQFIREEIAPDCDVDKLANNESLLESGILDSFGIMLLLPFIEDNLRVKIPADQLEPANFETLAAIVELVNRHQ